MYDFYKNGYYQQQFIIEKQLTQYYLDELQFGLKSEITLATSKDDQIRGIDGWINLHGTKTVDFKFDSYETAGVWLELANANPKEKSMMDNKATDYILYVKMALKRAYLIPYKNIQTLACKIFTAEKENLVEVKSTGTRGCEVPFDSVAPVLVFNIDAECPVPVKVEKSFVWDCWRDYSNPYKKFVC